MLFVCVNLGMHLGIEAEEALRHANKKFLARFACMERLIAEAGLQLEALSLGDMEAWWQKAKRALA